VTVVFIVTTLIFLAAALIAVKLYAYLERTAVPVYRPDNDWFFACTSDRHYDTIPTPDISQGDTSDD
jgi:hypothetical protein